jgi:hypothetical protein
VRNRSSKVQTIQDNDLTWSYWHKATNQNALSHPYIRQIPAFPLHAFQTPTPSLSYMKKKQIDPQKVLNKLSSHAKNHTSCTSHDIACFSSSFSERLQRLKKVLWRCTVHEQQDHIDVSMNEPASEGGEVHSIILGGMTFSMLLGEVPKDENGKLVQFDSLRCVL